MSYPSENFNENLNISNQNNTQEFNQMLDLENVQVQNLNNFPQIGDNIVDLVYIEDGTDTINNFINASDATGTPVELWFWNAYYTPTMSGDNRIYLNTYVGRTIFSLYELMDLFNPTWKQLENPTTSSNQTWLYSKQTAADYFTVGEKVKFQFYNTIPNPDVPVTIPGISANVPYYIVNVQPNATVDGHTGYQVSLTDGGTPITFGGPAASAVNLSGICRVAPSEETIKYITQMENLKINDAKTYCYLLCKKLKFMISTIKALTRSGVLGESYLPSGQFRDF